MLPGMSLLDARSPITKPMTLRMGRQPNGGRSSTPMMLQEPSRPSSQCSQQQSSSSSSRMTTSRRGRSRSPVDYNMGGRRKDPSSAAAAAAAAAAATLQDQQTPWYNNNNHSLNPFDQPESSFMTNSKHLNSSNHNSTNEAPSFADSFDGQNSFGFRHSFSFSKDNDHHRDNNSNNNKSNIELDHNNSQQQRFILNSSSPIHLSSRSPIPNSSDSHIHRNASTSSSSGPSSVFRGLPRQPHNRHDQQKILMSLRSHSTSFEEKDDSFFRHPKSQQPQQLKAAPLSPEEPPRIQHSHHQLQQNPRTQISSPHHNNNKHLFFEPQRSPRSPVDTNKQLLSPSLTNQNSIDMAPSFNLFNQSFDSLVVGDNHNNNNNSLNNHLHVANSFGAPFNSDVDSSHPYSRTTSLDDRNNSGLFTGRNSNNNNNTLDARANFLSKNKNNSAPPEINFSNEGISRNPSIMVDMHQSSSFGHPTQLSPQNKFENNTMILGRESRVHDTHSGMSLQPPTPQRSNDFDKHLHRNSQFLSTTNLKNSQSRTKASLYHNNNSHNNDNNNKGRSKYLQPKREQTYEGNQVVRSASSRNINNNSIARPVVSSHSSLRGEQEHSYYNVLLQNKEAFVNCQFLLPKLKEAVLSIVASAADNSNSANHHSPDAPMSNSNGDHTPKRDVKKEGDHHPLQSQETPPSLIKFNNGMVRVTPQVSLSPESNASLRSSNEQSVPSNIEIARRRVDTAICAFGGTIHHGRGMRTNSAEDIDSVFRLSHENSSFHSTDVRNKKTAEHKLYEQKLPSRFHEKGSRLSWDVEESPPVNISNNPDIVKSSYASLNDVTAFQANDRSMSSDDKFGIRDSFKDVSQFKNSSKRVKLDVDGRHSEQTSVVDQDEIDCSSSVSTQDHKLSSNDQKQKTSNEKQKESISGSDQRPKMRYRCKLCGQPKQNHSCPYQQSLQRSIGVSVYAAVNSFTACEPGYLAPALSEMNNFVTEANNSSNESSPLRKPSPDRPPINMMMMGPPVLPSGTVNYGYHGPPHVSPDMRNDMAAQHMRQLSSPSGSSIATVSGTPFRTPYPNNISQSIPGMMGGNNESLYAGGAVKMGLTTPASHVRRKKTLSKDVSPSSGSSICTANDLLFVDGTELRPEQYRIISPESEISGTYEYSSLPLPYSQRKRLSDSLFSLSKDVPHLTDGCALVLREAREQDNWDLAVAELITQVIIIKRCKETDSRFEGLRQYLLTLGFAC